MEERWHVLVVDNEVDICDMMRMALLATGSYRVTSVLRGSEALPVLDEDPPDLLIVDAVLPGMPGLELAAQALRRNTPVVIMTGHPEMMARLAESGCPHLSKPFRLDELLDSVRQAIAGAENNRRSARTSLDRLLADGSVRRTEDESGR